MEVGEESIGKESIGEESIGEEKKISVLLTKIPHQTSLLSSNRNLLIFTNFKYFILV